MNTGPGHVYVLGFSNGCVKVGRTKNASQRLGSHKSAASKFGLAIADEWLSPLHAEWLQNEIALKAIALELGGIVAGHEYFSGIEFATVAERAAALTFTAPSTSAQEAPRPAVPVRRLSADKEEAITRLLYPLAVKCVLTTNEARLRLKRMSELLDVRTSHDQRQLLLGYAETELQALNDDITRKHREIAGEACGVVAFYSQSRGEAA